MKILFICSLFFNVMGVVLLLLFIGRLGGLKTIIRRLTKSGPSISVNNRVQLFESLGAKDKIVFLGDSRIAQGEWAELLGRIDVANRGISGDTTEETLERLDLIISDKPKKIFIMVGINDFHKSRTVSDIFSNYQKIVNKIKEKSSHTKIYIQQLLPVSYPKTKTINNGNVELLNNQLKQIQGITFIEMEGFAQNNQLKSDYTNDGIHLNGKGYLEWREIILKYIR